MVNLIGLLTSFSGKNTEEQESMLKLVGLLNKDTLKTMQLLGFNYKEAIGLPLTEVCSDAIKNKLGSNLNKKGKNK